MEAERTLQFRAGLFTLIVLVGIGAMVVSINREGGLFSPRYTLYADFDNIEGLFPNASVLLAGNNVGRVRDVYFLDAAQERALRVELDIDARVKDRICTDSVASVYTSGVLGDMYVGITLGSPAGVPLDDQGVLRTREPFSFNAFYDKGSALLENLVALSASADRIVGSFEEAMGTESVASTLGSVQNIVREVETGEGMLHALIYDDSGAAARDLQTSVREFRIALERVTTILAEVEQGDGLLHEFIYGGNGEMSTLAAMRESSQRLESVLRKIDEGEGTLGALLNDPALYEDVKLLVSGAKESALLRTMIEFVRPGNGAP